MSRKVNTSENHVMWWCSWFESWTLQHACIVKCVRFRHWNNRNSSNPMKEVQVQILNLRTCECSKRQTTENWMFLSRIDQLRAKAKLGITCQTAGLIVLSTDQSRHNGDLAWGYGGKTMPLVISGMRPWYGVYKRIKWKRVPLYKGTSIDKNSLITKISKVMFNESVN